MIKSMVSLDDSTPNTHVSVLIDYNPNAYPNICLSKQFCEDLREMLRQKFNHEKPSEIGGRP